VPIRDPIPDESRQHSAGQDRSRTLSPWGKRRRARTLPQSPWPEPWRCSGSLGATAAPHLCRDPRRPSQGPLCPGRAAIGTSSAARLVVSHALTTNPTLPLDPTKYLKASPPTIYRKLERRKRGGNVASAGLGQVFSACRLSSSRGCPSPRLAGNSKASASGALFVAFVPSRANDFNLHMGEQRR
jgi:hypothetical protein